MSLQILRKGSKGEVVVRWQNFLIGEHLLRGQADGDFGPITEQATKAFQRSQRLTADGIVGPRTFGAAMMVGFDPGIEDSIEPDSNPVLVGTSRIDPVTTSHRIQMFGEFPFEPDPTDQNPERIRILNDWERENIKTIMIPQLKGIPVFGRPSSGKMRFHRKVEDQLKSLWEAWEDAGVVDRVLTYEGSFNARFIRGSRSTLSNHAFGSAFDINAKWNKLGRIPALAGEEGSVRELVSIANEHGFFWGGHFNNRPDGMHFEVANLL